MIVLDHVGPAVEQSSERLLRQVLPRSRVSRDERGSPRDPLEVDMEEGSKPIRSSG